MSRTKPAPIANRQRSKMNGCEVVHVHSPLFLTSAQQHACRYETTDGDPLALGYYLALWPAGACRSFYGRELRYLGPFATNITTRFLQTSALALGIVYPLKLPPQSEHRHGLSAMDFDILSASG